MKVKQAAEEVANQLERGRVIGIARLADADLVVESCAEAAGQGLLAVEVPLTVPGASRAISTLRARLGTEVLVGAGTVRTRSQLDDAIGAGAEFLVAPGLNAELVAAAAAAEVLLVPGVYTASEVDLALGLGLRLLKLFPAQPAGPEYMTALLQPFPEVRFVPTGGVGPENAAAFLRAGAATLGMGSSIFPTRRIGSEGVGVVRRLVADAIAAAAQGNP